MMRSASAFCLALLLWVAGFTAAGPATPRERVARGAAEAAMHAALATQIVAVRDHAPAVSRLPVERHPAGAGSSTPEPCAELPAERVLPAARVALGAHARAHVCRALWQTYDAHAPPARPFTA